MAHEIAHQWFGDAASEKNFSHVWLSEGFATYMTNLYLENKYGPDTLKNDCVKTGLKFSALKKEDLSQLLTQVPERITRYF